MPPHWRRKETSPCHPLGGERRALLASPRKKKAAPYLGVHLKRDWSSILASHWNKKCTILPSIIGREEEFFLASNLEEEVLLLQASKEEEGAALLLFYLRESLFALENLLGSNLWRGEVLYLIKEEFLCSSSCLGPRRSC